MLQLPLLLLCKGVRLLWSPRLLGSAQPLSLLLTPAPNRRYPVLPCPARYRWLCTPKGAAFLWAAKSVQPGLLPTVTSHGYGLVSVGGWGLGACVSAVYGAGRLAGVPSCAALRS